MLEVQDVVSGYGSVDVLDRVSLDVASGEAVALLGPNGAGKSTLALTLSGVLPARAGQIRFCGAEIGSSATHRIVASGLSVVPEGRRIFGPMTVVDNLKLGATRLNLGTGSVESRFDYVFSLFPRLQERRMQMGGTLSGGEQQMLAIGRALMAGPRLIVLDEPFLGIAPRVVDEIVRALTVLRQSGLALLLVEQKLDLALRFTQRSYLMVHGRVVQSWTSNGDVTADAVAAHYFEHGPATRS